MSIKCKHVSVLVNFTKITNYLQKIVLQLFCFMCIQFQNHPTQQSHRNQPLPSISKKLDFKTPTSQGHRLILSKV